MQALLLSLLVLAAGAPGRGAPERWPERMDALVRTGGLRGARVGVLVVERATGKVLYERRADELFVPASVTKIITSAAALRTLRPEYRWRSEIQATGARDGSLWRGDLYLKSWGDPLLVSERLWAMVDELKRSGMTRVEGQLHVDDGYFDRERFGENWSTRGRVWYDAPHGAVSVNFNVRTAGGHAVAIDEDPADHAAGVLLDLMRREGITVSGGAGAARAAPETARVLARSESAPLREVVAGLNKRSSNFIGEQILKSMGAAVEGAPGTAGKGIKVVSAYLRGLGVDSGGYRLADGSGMSLSNRLSPRVVVAVLQDMLGDFQVGPEFLASLKVAGVDGSRWRFQDRLCLRRMRVKTGHLRGVAALAGVARTQGEREVLFAILVNDYRHGRGAADRGIERLCEAFLADRDSQAPVAGRQEAAGRVGAASEPEPGGDGPAQGDGDEPEDANDDGEPDGR